MREDVRLRVLTKKPQVANAQEISENPRSRSAKLRVAERVEANSTPELPIPYSRANARSR
jgi:hypothetical protein